MFRTLMIALMIWAQIVKVESACDTQLQNGLFQDLLNMMMKIKGSSSAEPSTCSCKKIVIAFTASLSATKSIGSGAVVPFDKVLTNEGKGFDPNTGIFTAPRKGFYQISATTMSAHGAYFHSYLMKNNEKTVGMYPGQGPQTGSANIVMKLKKEDRVYIKHRNGDTEKIYSDPDHWSMISGFLISE
ncbi:complement C1q tumor necrosis factor-related protein 5-like isoform X2 [Mytilus galloprovincialis]|uniref:complement C1q tumor necrosis factor-related protein 5-like isoform X2 n=1 Tax=Mytilus galloprovincialis TaxID=29158 RepID=UPI003F7B435B